MTEDTSGISSFIPGQSRRSGLGLLLGELALPLGDQGVDPIKDQRSFRPLDYWQLLPRQ